MTEEKQRLYRRLEKQAAGLFEGETRFLANSANLCALLYMELPDINWVGFYFRQGGHLSLGPFQGKPACTRIEMGKGVCGTAAQNAATVVVENVHEFAGHIACDSASNSEIVIPLIRDAEIIGVLDVDSPGLARFDKDDAHGLEQLVAALLASVDLDQSMLFSAQ